MGKAGRFDRIGFDVISMRSELSHRPYKRPSENILYVKTQLEYLLDYKNTKKVLEEID